MGRPKNTIPPVLKNLSLPENLVDRVDLILWSNLEGKVPFGAWSRFVVQCIEEKLARGVQEAYKANMGIKDETE